MPDQNYEIQSESAAVDDLLFWSIIGHESLSRPSVYELTVLSRKGYIDPNVILGKAFDVIIHFQDENQDDHQRHCQGYAVRFMRMSKNGRYYEYRITLRSWFWLVTRRVNARIFQDKKVVEVMDAVFEDSPISGHKKTDDKISGQHDPRRYCVQYMESDYDFLSRLMEDEGIYYWFDVHDNPGAMVLADNSSSAHDPLPVEPKLTWTTGAASEARFNEISQWLEAARLDSGKYASRDSDFKAIRKKLGAAIDTSSQHDMADFEVFEFAGGYFDADAGDARARIRGDELIGLRDRYWGVTRWPDVAVGRSFRLEGLQGSEYEYIIGACTLAVTHPGYEGMNPAQDQRDALEPLRQLLTDESVDANTIDVLLDIIANAQGIAVGEPGSSAFLITSMGSELPYRPARLTPRKLMPGPQSAIVVGKDGKEIDADEFGRVKVHFHWDRYDQSNEKSTCWVRVSHPWAGKGWGGYFTPRIGQEVIVDFINGDPDRPVIMGRVYNDEQKIPYTSPQVSGFKTRSTPGGDSTTYNELRFDDSKGAELVNVQAQHNMSTLVKNDDSTTVGHDQSLTVMNNRTHTVKGNEVTKVEKDQTNSVVMNQTNTVNLVQSNVVGVTQVNIVGTSQVTEVGGPQTVVVGGAQTTTLLGSHTLGVTGAQSITVNGGQKTSVTGDVGLTSTGEMKIHAATRKDLADGDFSIMANKVKVVSNTDLVLMAVGNINSTSIGSNTTVLGSNSSGYIGSNTSANMGMASSTFMGMNVSNSLGIGMTTFMGLQIENTLALKLTGVAALDLSESPADIECTSMKIITPGAGGGGAAAAALVAAALGGFAAGFTGAQDVSATLKQYEDAKTDLDNAAAEAAQNGLPGLAGRLSSLAQVAARRRSDWVAESVPGADPLAALLGGGAASNAADALGNANPTTAGRPPGTGS